MSYHLIDTVQQLGHPRLLVVGDLILDRYIWGDADRSYRWPQVETLWTNLPDVRLSVIPGSAHAAHLEKPHLFHSLIDDFLSEDRLVEDALAT